MKICEDKNLLFIVIKKTLRSHNQSWSKGSMKKSQKEGLFKKLEVNGSNSANLEPKELPKRRKMVEKR